MHLTTTTINGVSILNGKLTSDSRGSFERVFCKDSFSSLGLNKQILQSNISCSSSKGTVRGLHYQIPPGSETKIISCIQGRVFDVSVDLRPSSPSYLKYFTVELDAKKSEMIVIPEGVAHGFQTLEDDCILLYMHTATYSPELEFGININDPTIGIEWPLRPSNQSERDLSLPNISSQFQGVIV